MYFSQEGDTYPVEYINGALITGRGKAELRDGSTYYGDFVKGKRLLSHVFIIIISYPIIVTLFLFVCYFI